MTFVELQQIADFVQGGRHGLSGKNFVANGFPAYGAGGVNGFLPEPEFNRDAVILSAIGARCGKCFLAEGQWSSLANTQVIFPDSKKADVRFLWYQLNDEARWPRRGLAQPFIRPSDVRAHKVFLPPLDEQRRIAAILDKGDGLRRTRKRAAELLDSLADATFLEMFEENSGATFELKDVVKAGTIVTYGIVQAGPEVVDGVPYIRTGDLVDGEIQAANLRRTNRAIAAKFGRSRVEAGDIVMSIRATVGTTAIVPPALEGANLTQGTARIAPGDKVRSEYLLGYLRSERIQRWIAAQVKGATFLEITLGRLRELPVAVPPMSRQLEFSRRMSKLRQLSGVMKVQKNRADALFSALQQHAFSGRL
ncbi:restriction endonuclease subunit S [Mesorhizobium sp. M0808]|uniref:restriction endonuclease subunit S n=1 Tax=Mesorhizobium sp. M0808 TaxID=2957002 RepID=UPI003339A3DF